ncbi:hypothetical protein HDV06_004555, partial [Boothiomyces sp. JEL0866]
MFLTVLSAISLVLAGDPDYIKQQLDVNFNQYNGFPGWKGYSVAVVAHGLDGTWDNCIQYKASDGFTTILVGNRDQGHPCGFTHCGDGGYENWAYEGIWHVDNVGT